jgi:hypothetical protein
MSRRMINVEIRVHILTTLIPPLLVHIHQKKKIAAKITSVNRPLVNMIVV